MVKIGSSQKRRLSKTVNFYGIRGEMYKFAEVGGKFINFVEIGGNATCIVGLVGDERLWRRTLRLKSIHVHHTNALHNYMTDDGVVQNISVYICM